MKRLLALTAAAAALAVPPAHAAQDLGISAACQADRLYVVYEASEGFVLRGAVSDPDSTGTMIRCDIVRFGTTVVATSGMTCTGPACATAASVSTPYGGMQVCTYAEFKLATGLRTYGPHCVPIPAP